MLEHSPGRFFFPMHFPCNIRYVYLHRINFYLVFRYFFNYWVVFACFYERRISDLPLPFLRFGICFLLRSPLVLDAGLVLAHLFFFSCRIGHCALNRSVFPHSKRDCIFSACPQPVFFVRNRPANQPLRLSLIGHVAPPKFFSLD